MICSVCGAPIRRVEKQTIPQTAWRRDRVCVQYVATCVAGHDVHRLEWVELVEERVADEDIQTG
jgi:hypothetical protein